MEIKLLRCLALEIFKTVNNLNPYYMKEIFSKTTNLTHSPFDINFNQNNTTKYGSNSFRRLGYYLPQQSTNITLNHSPRTFNLFL